MVFLCGAIGSAGSEESGLDACGLRGWNSRQGYQYVAMGTYPYYENGTRAPVIWRVLAVEDGKAFLLTEYVIGACQPIYCDSKSVADRKSYRRIDDYGESDMNTWLNEVMIQDIFTGDPLLAAVTEEQYGRLYPLSDKELMTEKYGFPNVRYFVHSERYAYATPYALTLKLHPNYGSRVQKDSQNGTSAYWATNLKQPGQIYLQIVGVDGHLSYGTLVRTSVGLRVALRLDTSLIQVASGSGTLFDPCTLAYVQDGRAAVAPGPAEATPQPILPKKGKIKNTPQPDATPVPTPEWLEGALTP